MISFSAFLLLLCHLDTVTDAFLVVRSDPLVQSSTAMFQSSNVELAETESNSSTTSTSTSDDHGETYRNLPLTASNPREFTWWNDACDIYLDELDKAGGERFVASHDEPDETGQTNTNNWLHVTMSNPNRRVQYEARYVDGDGDGRTQTMGGVVRFGSDCMGPEDMAHGGSIATIADALTATCCFKASKRWGMTTRLECNYRESIPLGTPVKIESKIVDLKKRKASLEWSIYSLTELDRKDQPVRHAFGSADFLLPRMPKE